MEADEENAVSPLEIMLKRLMLFLRHEVENEQRIVLATEDFRLSEHMTNIKISAEKVGDLPTASGLMNQVVTSCVFCTGSLNGGICFKSHNMTLDRKRDVLLKR